MNVLPPRSALASSLYTYKTAPEHPALARYRITERQLRRWVPLGKVEHEKVGERVFFTEAQILALTASFNRPATTALTTDD